jgi:hypothetical protein
MEGMPNRRQRRALAKQAGLIKLKQNSSFAQKLEMSKRARELGKQIHFANVERSLRQQDSVLQDKEQERLQQLMDSGMTPEEALEALQIENEKHVDGNMDSVGE